MPLIEFTDVPVVAVDFMNEVHEEEVGMINEFHELLGRYASGGIEGSEITSAANALFAHTKEHFEREERFMEEGMFPPYPIHKAEHDAFLEQFKGVLESWQASSDVAGLKGFLEEVLPAWLHQHIATMDFVTARFLSR